MREIKFRGLSIVSRTWFYGWYYRTEKGDDIIIDEGGNHIKCDSIGQYTGLKDKNGKEIYEGDILSHELPYKCDKCEQTHIIGVVEWDVDGWFLKCISEGDHKIYDSMGMIYDWEDREIIGNIYENKELLK